MGVYGIRKFSLMKISHLKLIWQGLIEIDNILTEFGCLSPPLLTLSLEEICTQILNFIDGLLLC